MRKPVQVMKIIDGLRQQAITSVASDYISLKNYNHCTILIKVDISSGTDTGALTLTQATLVDGTGDKELAYDTIWYNLDTEAGDTLTEATVTSNTYNLGGVEDKGLLYVVEIDASSLDVDNNFDCLRANIATITNGTGTVTYLLSNPRFVDQSLPGGKSAIID